MSEELDQLLLVYWQDAIHRRRKLEKYRRLMPHEPFISSSIILLNQRLDYLESMVTNKSLLVPARRRKRQQAVDIFGVSPWEEWYKMTLALTVIGGRMFVKNMISYFSAFNREKDDDGR